MLPVRRLIQPATRPITIAVVACLVAFAYYVWAHHVSYSFSGDIAEIPAIVPLPLAFWIGWRVRSRGLGGTIVAGLCGVAQFAICVLVGWGSVALGLLMTHDGREFVVSSVPGHAGWITPPLASGTVTFFILAGIGSLCHRLMLPPSASAAHLPSEAIDSVAAAARPLRLGLAGFVLAAFGLAVVLSAGALSPRPLGIVGVVITATGAALLLVGIVFGAWVLAERAVGAIRRAIRAG
jgi:hypothetical protein